MSIHEFHLKKEGLFLTTPLAERIGLKKSHAALLQRGLPNNCHTAFSLPSGNRRAHKLKRSPRDTGQCAGFYPAGTNRVLPAGVRGTSCCLLQRNSQKRSLLPGHRPGGLLTPGRPGAFEKFYVTIPHVPLLPPISNSIAESTFLLGFKAYIAMLLRCSAS